jgi:hypothetical protein
MQTPKHLSAFLKGFGGTKPLFISFFHHLLYIHTNSIIHIHSQHSLSSAPVSSSLQAQVEGLHWGAEPRFELGAALQQPYTPPTEPCRTLKNLPAGKFSGINLPS